MLPPGAVGGDEQLPANAVYVWGTRISVTHVQRTFRCFLLEYKIGGEGQAQQLDEDEVLASNSQRNTLPDEPYYLQQMNEVLFLTCSLSQPL
jgi:hypothetical protein